MGGPDLRVRLSPHDAYTRAAGTSRRDARVAAPSYTVMGGLHAHTGRHTHIANKHTHTHAHKHKNTYRHNDSENKVHTVRKITWRRGRTAVGRRCH